MKFQSTTTDNFQSWEKFLDAYYEPIRTSLSLVPLIGEARADELAQSFFVKMYERGVLENRPVITGRFRDWLYIAARRHAVDEWRKLQRRPEQPGSRDFLEPADPRTTSPENATFDADELYALSVLHLTVGRVRRHLIEEGKAGHWTIFEELVLAPLIPGRVPKSRDELLSSFPGQGTSFLDNRVTTVKRIFRRMLPALIPVDPTEKLSPDERFAELLAILHASKDSRLWLAFLANPRPAPEEPSSTWLDPAAWSTAHENPGAMVDPDILQDELRVLLRFWLELPLQEYLDELEGVGPALAALIRDTRPCGAPLRRPGAVSALALNLKWLIAGTDPVIATIPLLELVVLFQRIKAFAKRVHHSVQLESKKGVSSAARRENAMPVEIAQVLYNLAGALALGRCGVRIIGIGDDRYRKNVSWVLEQPWLDVSLPPVFLGALARLDTKASS